MPYFETELARARRWRERTHELRETVATIKDPFFRNRMERLARAYDEMAGRAETSAQKAMRAAPLAPDEQVADEERPAQSEPV